MTAAFDRIVITVPALSDAAGEYRSLLGVSPVSPPGAPGGERAWLALANTVIELVQRDVPRARVTGLVLATPGAEAADAPVDNALGLAVDVCDGSRSAPLREKAAPRGAAVAVDHVVLRTVDAQACVDFFAGRMGLRLALDQTVPEWGGRMLFFRAGGLTLEVIESGAGGAKKPGSYFWGIAYQCADIERFIADLDARGIAHSAVRDGRKPGTRVATVKSHCLDIPTLLIQPTR